MLRQVNSWPDLLYFDICAFKNLFNIPSRYSGVERTKLTKSSINGSEYQFIANLLKTWKYEEKYETCVLKAASRSGQVLSYGGSRQR